MPYELKERTKIFSINLIITLKKIQLDVHNSNIIKQLLRSGTSIGANYQEANGAISKSDFKNIIAICRKEALGTRYWIELLIDTSPNVEILMKPLLKENTEFILILSKIFYSTKS